MELIRPARVLRVLPPVSAKVRQVNPKSIEMTDDPCLAPVIQLREP